MIAIQGIRIEGIDIRRENNGKDKVTGDYSLISTQDKVLAKQGFNGYGEIEVGLSASTIGLLNKFLASVKEDVKGVLGLTEEEKK